MTRQNEPDKEGKRRRVLQAGHQAVKSPGCLKQQDDLGKPGISVGSGEVCWAPITKGFAFCHEDSGGP